MSSPSVVAVSEADSMASVFGSLEDIPDEAIVRLAVRVGRTLFETPSPKAEYIRRTSGSYNLVHIVQVEAAKLVIRLPATGQGDGMTATAKDAFKSQIATMKLIGQRTSVPVPKVYSFDCTHDNEIGAPYVCMSFVEGTPVSQMWFSSDTELPLEKLRLNILKSVARVMTKFSKISFNEIGSITQNDAGRINIGPAYDWKDDDNDGGGHLEVASFGPFKSTTEYIRSQTSLKHDGNIWDKSTSEVVEALLSSSRNLGAGQGFVLCPPDFDSQNIMVNGQGRVTGIIDWDHAQTLPRRLGYARYPSWITRDWDPLMYAWPHMADAEDSPETLARYRAYYNRKLGKALRWHRDWKFTKKSHLAEAVWIAAFSERHRTMICEKFIEAALGPEVNPLDVLCAIGEGYYDESEWKKLRRAFDRMLR